MLTADVAMTLSHLAVALRRQREAIRACQQVALAKRDADAECGEAQRDVNRLSQRLARLLTEEVPA